MSGPSASILRRATAALLAVALSVLAACTSDPGRPPARTIDGDPGDPPLATDAPEVPTYRLTIEVRRVEADAVASGVRPRDLAGPVEAIRQTMGELYTIGFVDPVLWDDGEFPSLFRLFAADARPQASRDVADLTLGPIARRLDAVRPRPARLDVRFLADGRGRAVVAVAHVRFAGTAQAGDAEAPVEHEGQYVLRRINGRWRVVSYEVRGRVPGGDELRAEPRSAALIPSLVPRRPLFVLVIGSDARPGQSVERSRADSIHIVGVNPREGRVSLLGIPRDSWVSIPGRGSDKINAALALGGPRLLVETVERLTGIRFDAYVLTGFAGFQTMVAAVGGFDMKIPYAISDPWARAYFRKGPEHLSGAEALAFSRVRKDLPNGDFGRSFNQGRVMVAALATLREHLAGGPAEVLPWVVAGAKHLRTDLSMTEMLELLVAAPSFRPSRVRNAVVPGHVGMIGSKSVVLLSAGAHAMFRDIERDALLG